MARMRENGNAYRFLVGKHETKRPLKHWCRREDNIKMTAKEIRLEGVDRINFAQDVGWWWCTPVVNRRVPKSAGKYD